MSKEFNEWWDEYYKDGFDGVGNALQRHIGALAAWQPLPEPPSE